MRCFRSRRGRTWSCTYATTSFAWRAEQNKFAETLHRLGPPLSHGGSPSAPSRAAAWLRSPCLGLCDRAPAALVTVAGEAAEEIALAPATREAIETVLQESGKGLRPQGERPRGISPAVLRSTDSAPLLRRIGNADP